jgi:hypothetical protein
MDTDEGNAEGGLAIALLVSCAFYAVVGIAVAAWLWL